MSEPCITGIEKDGTTEVESPANVSQDDCNRWDFCGREWDDWERLYKEDPAEAERQMTEYRKTREGEDISMTDVLGKTE
jgi:hypothetical protein